MEKNKDKEIAKPAAVAVGRRKRAVARARLYLSSAEVLWNGRKLEKGDVFVNGMPIDEYFTDPFSRGRYQELFRTTNTAGRFIITVLVKGSGPSGQAGAVVLALARVLCKFDEKFRPILKKKGYLTRDPREKERKKPGLPGARKEKASPKR